MTERRWEFWIDVGGTFTDCIARRPDGTLVRHKLLSSAVVKGAAAEGSTQCEFRDPRRAADPAGFWNGYRLALLDSSGSTVAESQVAQFDQRVGVLALESPLEISPAPGQPYELRAEELAPVLAIRYLLGLRRDEMIPPVSVRLGTTRGTNALITRRGAKTGLVTTRGFADVLAIGYQNRPRLFDLAIKKPAPLYERVVEIDERVTFDGQVLQRPDPAEIRMALAGLREAGVESLAVCLLHSYAQPEHERLVGRIARELGFAEVSLSCEVAPLRKIVSRGDTTVVDAYLNPVLRAYIAELRKSLPQADLRVLTSAGGLVQAERFVGKDSILSGPAGGVVGFSRVAQAAGFTRAIGFDMGGTSTDVARFDGNFEREYETEKAGVRVVAPMMAIETVAAGGGSICGFDGVKLAVGPESAGADPGPACYGKGGPLAVTDLNVYLGRIPADRFPFPLDRAAVERRLQAICREIRGATGQAYKAVELADGFLKIAGANMAKAIRSISIAKGADPRAHVLVSFGGAAPQHACDVARQLDIRQILNHPDGGILSAYGIGLADVVRHRVESVNRLLADVSPDALVSVFSRLTDAAQREVELEGIDAENVAVVRQLDLRYRGLDAFLTIDEPKDGGFAVAYGAAFEALYGYQDAQRPLEVVAARAEATGRFGEELPESHHVDTYQPEPHDRVRCMFQSQPHEAPLYLREELRPGAVLRGPAIVAEHISTTVIDPGWEAEMLSGGELLLTDRGGEPSPIAVSTEADPVTLELFNNQFAGIAEQMGITLRNTASSVNVKERLDFSCAIFTSRGDLVVNAPHIPVHLGAMGETVRSVIADHPHIAPGDAFVTNDPYRGGSHLPDVTVVTPVHDPVDGTLLFFTASRAHHAEIGGVRPGSMPPFSRSLAEEGVLIRSFNLLEGGRSREEVLRKLLLSGPHPTRSVEDNLADIRAQLAANRQGGRDLIALIQRHSRDVVLAYMRHIQDAAERKTRTALAQMSDGTYRFTDHLDDGSPIAVAVTIRGDSARVDFTGTGPVVPGNLNANRAIVTAAVMYCFRLLLKEDIPLNQGVLKPIELVLPVCLLNPPEADDPGRCAAVAGGNVETSQRVVDVLLGALQLAAASQGTMNNLLFGDATFGYYETLCGGAGATAESPGADAVHTHMTNTRLTDVEVLEARYPVRVRQFGIRRGSGGRGAKPGGDGVVRRIEFLRDLEVSIISQRRAAYPPYGLAGGQPGALGRNVLQQIDGSQQELGATAQFVARAGDVLIIETPGGGGYGAP
ncbi:MAG: hydantoinase B/oxoprolinase family protein [Pirellulales bacterium]